ncbi:hypothetical protein FYK55_21135 [Roseiconus nitratireducens]|uniref:Alpha-L-glutamate ligase-related protein ATP-grasp domain-containing protein n=1 Tax=Roseiconus nitratireducens TaxID=2605748 RepID=A0A5M6D2J2_9BACT|nr:sugar-transfer associated ATP-grasp domain-containing protein [Roseiconus nitratireducens]KAA5540512.1 hypothetical protein FYK55_21135 [Roseiconus nitratireducens]
MTLPSSVLQAPKFVEDLTRSKKTVDHAVCMQNAMKSGKNIASQMWEFLRLSRCPGQLNLKDYFMYQLYDDDRFTFNQKREFVSESFYFQIIEKCCDRRWWILADDKFWSYKVFESNGFPVPETQAVVCVGKRAFGGVKKIADVEQLRRFFESEARFPIYSKPIDGIGSFGNFLIQGYDDGALRLHDDTAMSVEDFMGQIDSKSGQLLQTMLTPHRDLEDISRRVSTIRVILIIRDGEAKILSTVWKIPANENIADNFWRDGNQLGAVEVATGKVTRVVGYQDGTPQEIPSDAEASRQLVGRQLPDWDAAMDLCRRGAEHFLPLKFQSWDIALTDDGPVVVELNPGSAFLLPQLAEGKGFLTDEFYDFLQECGCKLKARS